MDLKLRKGGFGRIKLGQYDDTQELAFESPRRMEYKSGLRAAKIALTARYITYR